MHGKCIITIFLCCVYTQTHNILNPLFKGKHNVKISYIVLEITLNSNKNVIEIYFTQQM